MRKNSNKSNFHYRSETESPDGSIKTKYYMTLKEICEEYNTSTFTIYRIMKKEDYEPQMESLKNIKFFKDYKPAYVMIPNSSL